jgi:hypothetical protein
MRAETSALAGKVILSMVGYYVAGFLLQGLLLVPCLFSLWHELDDVASRLDYLRQKAPCPVKFGNLL